MSARYAIYYAPHAEDPFSFFANRWLGRDSFSGKSLDRPMFEELQAVDIDGHTKDPRHYGFHATLKAPFELNDKQTESGLIVALQEFCLDYKAFEARIAPMALFQFIAFQLTDTNEEMDNLHAACVHYFEPFRAQLSEKDIQRRRKANLSSVQDERLIEFGYPYIFEDFRFHMTLSGAIKDEQLRNRILETLQNHFREYSGLHKFWGLSLFKQENRDRDFLVINQTAFGQ